MGLYKRLPLDKTKSEIRLLCLTSCEPPSLSSASSRPQLSGFLGVVRLEGHRRRRLPYRAVSYVWGEPIFSETLLLNDGHRLAVTPTVVDALRTFWLHAGSQPVARGRGWGDSEELSDGDLGSAFLEEEPQALLRDPPGMLFWVDQVCIDQRNSEERGHQVGLMSKVYSWAWRTLVWLGQAEVAGASDQTQQQCRFDIAYSYLLDSRYRHGFDMGPVRTLDDRLDKRTVENLMELLSSTWFTRIWVVQEFALSHHVSLFYGSFRIRRGIIDCLSDLFQKLSRTYTLGRMPTRLQSSLRNCNAMIALRHWRHPDLYGVLFAQSLCSEFNCTDPRNRVYALFGFLDERGELPFQPDYNSTLAETYRMLATSCLKQGLVVSLLAFAGLQEPADNSESHDGIPSWCPTHRTTKSTPKSMRIQMRLASSVPRVQHHAGSNELWICGRVDGETVANAGLVVDGSQYATSGLNIIDWVLGLSISSKSHANETDTEYALNIMARLMSFDSRSSHLSVSLEAFKDWHNFVNAHQPSLGSFSYVSRRQPTHQSETGTMDAASGLDRYKIDCCDDLFRDGIHGQRLCCTTGGRLGVFPRLSQVGDVIAVISGLSLPLVLRPVADGAGKYMLVGAAFVLDFPELPCSLDEDDAIWIILV